MAESSNEELVQLIKRFGAYVAVIVSYIFPVYSLFLNSRSVGAVAGFALAIVFTWRLFRPPGEPQRMQPKRQAPSSSNSVVAAHSPAPLAPLVIHSSEEDLQVQNVVDEFFQSLKPTLGQIVRQKLSEGRKVTCRLLGVFLGESNPEELQQQAAIRSSVLEVLLEITKYCYIYLMERVLDDHSEKNVIMALTDAGIFTSGGLVKDKVPLVHNYIPFAGSLLQHREWMVFLCKATGTGENSKRGSVAQEVNRRKLVRPVVSSSGERSSRENTQAQGSESSSNERSQITLVEREALPELGVKEKITAPVSALAWFNNNLEEETLGNEEILTSKLDPEVMKERKCKRRKKKERLEKLKRSYIEALDNTKVAPSAPIQVKKVLMSVDAVMEMRQRKEVEDFLEFARWVGLKTSVSGEEATQILLSNLGEKMGKGVEVGKGDFKCPRGARIFSRRGEREVTHSLS